ncbi:hypothetical protein [Streptomyces sp. b84]|nr:hypothetical protein [Streptomyces sp. b84]
MTSRYAQASHLVPDENPRAATLPHPEPTTRTTSHLTHRQL